MPGFYRAHLTSLQDAATRLLETQNSERGLDRLARELLREFCEVCLHAGLDGVLAQLELLEDPDAEERPALRADLVTRLGSKDTFDPRGPRTAQPRQLADCVLATLGIVVEDEPDRLSLSGEVRAEVAAALASVLEVELAAPKLREDIIAWARGRCDGDHRQAFGKITAQLDERGMRMLQQPKVPIHMAQAIQQHLVDARHAVLERAINAAIDRAQPVLARANPEAAQRLDRPITLRLTPRDVACRRAADPRAPKAPAQLAPALLDDLAELARYAWRTAERVARPYSAKQSFAVGELLDHPKFGRGTVTAVSIQRIDVEFPDGKVTLVHARA